EARRGEHQRDGGECRVRPDRIRHDDLGQACRRRGRRAGPGDLRGASLARGIAQPAARSGIRHAWSSDRMGGYTGIVPEGGSPRRPATSRDMAAAQRPGADLILLDGGTEAYPRMLAAIERARRVIHLEVFLFRHDGVGQRFEAALAAAAGRGVSVRVVLDGWGSAIDGRSLAARLSAAGCEVRIHHRLRSLLRARFQRNHRKLLAVDDEVAFVGGINIGDEYDGARVDLAVELHGPAVSLLWAALRGDPPGQGKLRILLSGAGGSWALRRRYLKAIHNARDHVALAHGYFLPDPLLLRALARAARRGVRVTVLVGASS